MADTIPRFIDVTEVAKLVRQSLKKNFPDVQFYVRSRRHAGGASIHVVWKEGPQEDDVHAKVKQYEGSRTDGDYSPRPVYHYLRPDGEALVAHNPASSAIGASEPQGEDNRALARLMTTDVELVKFGADYVFCHREPSEAETAEMQRRLEEARKSRRPDDIPF